MSIPFSRYVNIISGVAAGAGVRTRDLILRLFTSSPMIGPDTVLEYDRSNLAAIADYFGSTSEEYKRAAAYFGYVSPAVAAPQRISFASYRPADVGAAVYGNDDFKSIATIHLITAGAMSVRVGGVVHNITGVDMSGAASMTAAAALLQTAAVAAGLTDATVSYNGARFIFTLGTTHSTIAINSTVSGANDMATVLGLTLAVGAIPVSGSSAVNAVQALQASEQLTDNFGSLVFVPVLALADVQQVAAYVAARNVKYQYHTAVTAADAVAWNAALIGYAGLGLTLSPFPGEYPELIPPAILAATRYDQRGAVQNYMFKQMAGVSASVKDGQSADLYDGLRINYYGDTSTAGQIIKFYQRGTLCGGPTDPVDMNTYANEQWLKDYVGARLMELLLGVSRVPANAQGVGMVSNAIQPAIDLAVRNGTISVGKVLNATQKIYLTQATGDPLAYLKVQSQGYILTVEMQSYTTVSGAIEWKAVYVIYYAKDDAIRLVDGTHSLI